jgi:hypothetical protein
MSMQVLDLPQNEQFISHCVLSTSYKLRYLSFCWLDWWTLAISLNFILLMRVNLESNTNQGHRYSKNTTTHYLYSNEWYHICLYLYTIPIIYIVYM